MASLSNHGKAHNYKGGKLVSGVNTWGGAVLGGGYSFRGGGGGVLLRARGGGHCISRLRRAVLGKRPSATIGREESIHAGDAADSKNLLSS